MRLVLLGIDPLDRMEHWARQYFAAVPNRHIAPPTHPNGAWETPVRTTEQYAKLYTVRARAGRRELHMYWVLPPQYTQVRRRRRLSIAPTAPQPRSPPAFRGRCAV